MSETWTITRLLDWCTNFFHGKNIDSSRLDSEILLAHTLQLTRMQLYLNFDRPLTEPELAAFKELVKRRARQEPVAYIVGKKEFWSHDFIVKPGVLIPRPDTEVLIEQVLKSLRGPAGRGNPELDNLNTTGSPRFARDDNVCIHGFELGTGSGAIAISLLTEIPTLHMTAVEISQTAFEVTTENAHKHGVMDRLNLHHINFSDWLKTCDTAFDFIVSNPPYISESEYETLSETIRNFEPKEALVAQQDGLAFYQLLASFAKARLKNHGFIAVEIGETQGEAVAELFQNAGLSEPAITKDYANLNRVVTAKSC